MSSYRNIKLVLVKELRDVLRDKRTLMTMLFLPVVLYPLLVLVFAMMMAGRAEKVLRVAVVAEPLAWEAPDDNPATLLKQALLGRRPEAHTREDTPPSPGPAIEVVLIPDVERARTLLDRAAIEAVLVLPSGFARRAWQSPEHLPRVIYRPTEEDSIQARSELVRMLGAVRERTLLQHAESLDDDQLVSLLKAPLVEEPPRTAEAKQKDQRIVQAKSLSRMLIFLVLVMALSGAFYPAIDTVAGEKERGTLETLLASPASRLHVVLGKFAAVFVFSVATAIVNVLAMALTLFAVGNAAGDALALGFSTGEILQLAGKLFPLMVLVLVPVAALFSALALAASAHARSAREAQYYFAPLFMVVMPLSLSALLPHFTLSPLRALIPVGGASLLFRDLFSEIIDPGSVAQWHWGYVPLVFASTAVYAWVALNWTRGLFEDEKVLFRESGSRGVAGLFQQHWNVLTGLPTRSQAVTLYVVALALVVFVGFATPLGPVGALVVQMVGLFVLLPVGASALSKLNPVKTFRLRGFNPLHGVLALVMVPALSILVKAVSIYLLPLISPEAIEIAKLYQRAVEQLFAYGIVPAYLLVALTPAVCEELFFRGYLLSGFRQKSSVWASAVVTGALFSVFHMEWTGMAGRWFLGVVLAVVVIRTGSIWTGVLMHLLNNAMEITWMIDWAEGSTMERAVTWLTSTIPWYFQSTNPMPLPAVALSLLVVAGCLTTLHLTRQASSGRTSA
ncbi:MAG: ABC transporter permease subunit/CPBP intramembrane protease [Planctomycetota bacterium]